MLDEVRTIKQSKMIVINRVTYYHDILRLPGRVGQALELGGAGRGKEKLEMGN
jgi:hypothetical protein